MTKRLARTTGSRCGWRDSHPEKIHVTLLKIVQRDSLSQAFLCATFLFEMENVHLFSSSLSCFDKCHETSPIFPRTEQTFASARSFGVISRASFSRKNGPFDFERAPSATLKKPSQSQKEMGHFSVKMNAINDTKTSELSKSAEGNEEYL